MILPRDRVRFIARVLILLTDICSWQMAWEPSMAATKQCIKCKNSCSASKLWAELLKAAPAYTPCAMHPCYSPPYLTVYTSYKTAARRHSWCLHSVEVIWAVLHYVCAIECLTILICSCSAHAAVYWGVLWKLAIRFWSNCVKASEAERSDEPM
jgi:hypothetical protein